MYGVHTCFSSVLRLPVPPQQRRDAPRVLKMGWGVPDLERRARKVKGEGGGWKRKSQSLAGIAVAAQQLVSLAKTGERCQYFCATGDTTRAIPKSIRRHKRWLCVYITCTTSYGFGFYRARTSCSTGEGGQKNVFLRENAWLSTGMQRGCVRVRVVQSPNPCVCVVGGGVGMSQSKNQRSSDLRISEIHNFTLGTLPAISQPLVVRRGVRSKIPRRNAGCGGSIDRVGRKLLFALGW